MTIQCALNILTFNWHEAYLSMLAETGHHFSAVQVQKGGHYGWQTSMRPVPDNVTLCEEADALADLREGKFHLVVCHNMRDVLTVEAVAVPKILIFHNKISTEIALGGHQLSAEQYRNTIKDRIAKDRLTLVFISESKRDNCGLDGPVILPGINPTHYGGYRGEIEKVLRVGNLMKQRDIMLGFSWQEEILRDIPSTLLGINRTVPGSRVSESWEDLKNHYQSHRLFLNTTLHPWEDGYNLAMLEAMATGMPVVSMANLSSPIVDGVTGHISEDPRYLRQKIQELLSDRERAAELGLKGRETVGQRFSITRFVERWNGLFERVVGQSRRGLPVRVRKGRTRHRTTHGDLTGKNVLLCYTANPIATGHYLERSLRKHHNVLTCGPCMTSEMIEAWDLGRVKEKPKAHDFHSDSVNVKTVMESVGSGWHPDFLLWVETGVWFSLDGLESLDCPKACYLIDTHLHPRLHVQWASHFDVVFLAQKAYIPVFRKAGIENVYWLPLACDADIHGKKRIRKRYDIGFVGSINPENPRRTALLDRLSKRFNVHVERCFLRDMARVFSASKIVFNNAIRDDLNMRVFEALCTGSLLLTDRTRGSGLEELFQDRTHLVMYEDENLEDLAQYYLDHEEERQTIATHGRKEVLERHTYDHRTLEIVRRLEKLRASGRFVVPRDARKREKPDDSPGDPQQGTRLGQPGEQLERKGCLTQAKDAYLDRLKRDSQDRESLVGLGRISMQLGQWGEAGSYLERAVDPGKDGEALFLLARCKVKSGKLSEALSHLETARGHDGGNTPHQTEILNLMGDCLAQMGEYDKAEATYRKVIETDARSDDAWTGLGVLNTLRGDYRKAEEAFTKAAEINPKNDRVLCGLGVAFWNAGQKDQGFESLQRSLDINPENLTSLNHLLTWSHENGRIDVTEEYLKRYLDLHPLDLGVLHSLGGIYYKLRKYDAAGEIVETIRMFQPDHEGARELASLLSRKGNGDRETGKAIKDNPAGGKARFPEGHGGPDLPAGSHRKSPVVVK